MGSRFWSLLPLKDYLQARHGLLLPAELACAVEQDGV